VVQGREQPLDTLERVLADRDMLIVVDNFEQVLEAAPVLADLLQRARCATRLHPQPRASQPQKRQGANHG
jgi:hypothetical protein